ncbi:hypothetical protein LAZ67_18000951, partial [Cordylochernes scorpioides]
MYELLDICHESLRNLETIGLERNEMVDVMLIHFLQKKLDTPIRQQWELSYDNQELPSYQRFISFLEKQAQSLMNTMKDTTSKEYLNKRVNTYNINVSFKNCLLCKLKHKLNQCNEFRQMSIQNRIGYVKLNQLCSNCLRGNHSVENCKITNRCFHCNKNHHTLLHVVSSPPRQRESSSVQFASPKSVQPSNVPSTSTSCCLSEADGSIQILLSTPIIHIQDVNGEDQICRALLDNGSQRSLITEKCAAKLGIPIRRKRIAVGGSGDQLVESSLGEVLIRFSSHFDHQSFETTALVLTKLTNNIPSFTVKKINYSHMKGLILADPSYFKSKEIDVILGSDIVFNLIQEGRRNGNENEPSAIHSKLGWLVYGPTSVSERQSFRNMAHFSSELESEDLIKRFWELKSIPLEEIPTKEEKDCESPKLQNNIFNILLKFRTNSVALVADIEKMYRQISLHSDDIKYQTIVWRDCKDLELQEYNLLTVTYGLACAPYLAIRTLHQIAHEVQVSNPRISKIIREDFYVDDLLTGCPTVEDAKGLMQQLIAVLGSGGFVLRKWVSNETSIIEDLPSLLRGKGEVMEFNRKESGVNVLGIQWDPSYDTLNISCKSGPADIKSKRQIVSAIARIYDPCGWLSPTTVVLKLLLQEIWKLKIGWDEDIPASIQRKLLNYEELLTLLAQIEACLNSRPLTFVSNDPNDLTALTPGHFLIGNAIRHDAESDHSALNLRSRWNLIQPQRDYFWNRWSCVYLHQLQERRKWRTSDPDVNIGDLVMLKEKNKPLQWKLARIVQIFPGEDDHVRVVLLRTPKGLLKRPITKICPLPYKEDVLQGLSIPVSKVDAQIYGINATKGEEVKDLAHFAIRPLGNQDWELPLQALVFMKSGKIDLILGADVYGLFLLPEIRRDDKTQLCAQNTKLGWIISGGLSGSDVGNTRVFTTRVQYEDNLETILKRFWEVEEVRVANKITPQDEFCEDLCKNSVRRDTNGRYIVPLPFDPRVGMQDCFGNSLDLCVRRQMALERRLALNDQLGRDYYEFMEEYEGLGHMTQLTEIPVGDQVGHCYLPHHAVLGGQPDRRKFRVAFDASAKTKNGFSFNDRLYTGPKLQIDILSIMMNCRRHRIFIMSDIEKMYRQILVHPSDAERQRIIWRRRSEDKLMAYRLNTVTYGTAAAPFLAMRTLLKLVEDEGVKYPRASKAIIRDTYVDDIITGADDLRDGMALRDELIELLRCGGFTLKKWSSNDLTILGNIAKEHCAQKI